MATSLLEILVVCAIVAGLVCATVHQVQPAKAQTEKQVRSMVRKLNAFSAEF